MYSSKVVREGYTQWTMDSVYVSRYSREWIKKFVINEELWNCWINVLFDLFCFSTLGKVSITEAER